MEKLSDYSILTGYSNRQVILNEYLDEDYLEERHGFHFQTVAVTDSILAFSRKGKSDFYIPIEKSAHFYVNDDFQNYYILRNGSKRLEIYFP
ncbi:hypothetical protein [Bacillus benzoevorans]|uniref:Uncharacterized protein n=1 Tax=Bacillus benzoevorans TaxID=1456 RepID=A0A7X0HSE4_9BACI|nr:hypothetical protein [Bacillus benzoevorans]MBB6444845.1 hypothetical protein [Bacillus benzoevorans]